MSADFTDPKTQIFVYDPGVAERAAMDLNGFETTFLTVARHVFETYENPDAQCWMTAFMEAERVFPAPFGATLAHAIAVAVNGLMIGRTRAFSYFRSSDPLADQAITTEERYFVMILRCLRDHRYGMARTNAVLVCEGGHTAELLAAIERICIITGDVQQPRLQPA
ncbi:MAG: hypothetical protein HRU32_10585 [Rhodobacteraceae bacterium]|nr:hypothetical protein [Paracoccaceae bacterium]